MIHFFRKRLSIAGWKAVLVLACLLSFVVVSTVHSTHHVGELTSDSSVQMMSAADDGGSLSAGVLLQSVGWQVMNLILLPWLGFAAAAILWLGQSRKTAKDLLATSRKLKS